MSDYKGDNVLERLGALVPGFAGYAQREGRRKSDKLLRTSLAKEVHDKKQMLDDIVQRFSAEGKLAVVPHIDAIRRHLDLIGNRLAYANYGTSGFFDIIQINERDLDRVYSHDLAMVASIRECLQKIDGLSTASEPVRLVSAIRDGLNDIAQLIDGRNKILVEG